MHAPMSDARVWRDAQAITFSLLEQRWNPDPNWEVRGAHFALLAEPHDAMKNNADMRVLYRESSADKVREET